MRSSRPPDAAACIVSSAQRAAVSVQPRCYREDTVAQGSPRAWIGPLVALLLLAAVFAWFLAGHAPHDVVLYCGVDQDQSRAMVEVFEKEHGLTVDFHGENEAYRSIGLPNRLTLEKDDPKADVYWSNEIMHMIHLADVGIIDELPKGLAETFPEAWRDPRGRFIQFGARARVLLVNTELLPDPKDHPRSVRDLLNPKYADRGLATSMARPLTGTTYTHAVAELTRDEAGAKAFFEAIVRAGEAGHVKLVKSNGQVMRTVSDAENKVAFGLTDTDDAWIAIQRGAPVVVVYPDQGEGDRGTMLIPNTAGLVRGRRHGEAAETLLRWLASPETEAALAAGPSAQIPVRPGVSVPDDGHVKLPGKDFRAAHVDWYATGANIDRWRDYLTKRFRAVESE